MYIFKFIKIDTLTKKKTKAKNRLFLQSTVSHDGYGDKKTFVEF